MDHSRPLYVLKRRGKVLKGPHGTHLMGKEDAYALAIHHAGAPKWIKIIGEKMVHPEKVKVLEDIKEYLGLNFKGSRKLGSHPFFRLLRW